MVRFSVILMAWQSAWCIQDAIRSVLSQSVSDWDCLICDDASTDGTAEVVREYLSDSRITYFRQPQNVGQALNWMHGLTHAKAKYVATLHADDVWFEDALATYLSAFDQSTQCDLVSGDWLRTDSQLRQLAHQPQSRVGGDYVHDTVVRRVLLDNPFLPSASAFRRKLIDSAGFPNPEYGMLCDREYFLRLSVAARSVAILDRRVMRYRVHEGSVTNEYVRNHRLLDELLDFERRLDDYVKDYADKGELIATYKEMSADFFFRNGITIFQDGDFRRAGEIIEHARQCDPRLLRSPKRLIKWLVYRCGPWGRRLMPYIHNRNTFVTDVV
jgi:glycosyltransferase involved in cell wall biosynthesis